MQEHTCEDGESSLVTRISQGDPHTSLQTEALDIGGRDVEDDGDREEGALALAVVCR